MIDFDAMHYPLSVFKNDRDLLVFLRKVRDRAVRWNHSLVSISYQAGSEVGTRGGQVLLHQNPDFPVKVKEQIVERVDAWVTTKVLKKWTSEAKKKASATKRTLAIGLLFIEVLKKHPSERSPEDDD